MSSCDRKRKRDKEDIGDDVSGSPPDSVPEQKGKESDGAPSSATARGRKESKIYCQPLLARQSVFRRSHLNLLCVHPQNWKTQ